MRAARLMRAPRNPLEAPQRDEDNDRLVKEQRERGGQLPNWQAAASLPISLQLSCQI
jgi:hypothetical protein